MHIRLLLYPFFPIHCIVSRHRSYQWGDLLLALWDLTTTKPFSCTSSNMSQHALNASITGQDEDAGLAQLRSSPAVVEDIRQIQLSQELLRSFCCSPALSPKRGHCCSQSSDRGPSHSQQVQSWRSRRLFFAPRVSPVDSTPQCVCDSRLRYSCNRSVTLFRPQLPLQRSAEFRN